MSLTPHLLPSPIIYCLLLFNTLTAQSLPQLAGTSVDASALAETIEELRSAANVHGLYVAVVSADSLLFTSTAGYANQPEKQLLRASDNFYAASLAKPVFAVIAAKLVEEGRLDLDRPLVDYFDRPLGDYTFPEKYEGFGSLEADERHRLITARMCLSHTAGLPNWRYLTDRGVDMDNPLVFEFDPGTRYGYSGEGIQFLQLAVEQITGQGLEELARVYVFDRLEMGMTSYTWQDRFEGNYAVGHHKKKKALPRRKRVREYAAGSMDTTPEEYTRFVQAMLGGTLLGKAMQEETVRPQITISSLQQFGPNRLRETDANRTISLSYGLGWGLYFTPHGKAVFKEGHIAGWEHYVVFYPEHDLGLVIMANSSNGESIFQDLLEITVGDTWMPWYWEGFIPYGR